MKNLKSFNYKTSKDYELLFELIKVQRVVCFVKNRTVYDICANTPSLSKDIDIGVRGRSYIYAVGKTEEEIKKDFISQCEDYELEFILPNKTE